MGVKGLWTLFAPYCERKSLYEIRGEKVAIDLSGWICDSQNVSDNHAQPRMYLRNLYFRTCYILMHSITPIFVLEGEAPLAKRDVMANRNLIQFKNHYNNAKEINKKIKKPDRKRKHFSSILSHCEKLLYSMGLECVQGNGEAEAMCAYLNTTGHVAAVISQDSDSFVYGATRVYRNFSVSNSGSNSTNSGSVDIYDLNNIKKSLDFGRKKMVALALLCGSDYNGKGVQGIGYSNAIAFLSQQSDDTVLDRFISWINEPEKYNKMEKSLNDPGHCNGCGHKGNIRLHSRSGCLTCKTNVGCDQSVYKLKYQSMKIELNIRKKALEASIVFPDTDIIDEYLIEKESVPENFRPRWKKPDLIKFVKLMTQFLGWTEYYCVEKFLPLLTRWQLLHKSGEYKNENISLLINNQNDKSWITPHFIKKKRNPKGVACYEVVWKDTHDYYEGLVPDDQLEDNGKENLWTTVERQDLMEVAYPEIVNTYLASKNAKKTKATKTRKQLNQKQRKKEKPIDLYMDDMADINNSMKELNINKDACTTERQQRKRKIPTNEVSFKTKPKLYKKKNKNTITKNQRKMDSFIKNKHKLYDENSKENIIINQSNRDVITSKTHKYETTLDLINAFNEITDENISDDELSNIIENIVKRKDDFNTKTYLDNDVSDITNTTPVKAITMKKFKRFKELDVDFCSTPVHDNNKRISYFFDRLDSNNDEFETSLDLKNAPNYKINSYSPITCNFNKSKSFGEFCDISKYTPKNFPRKSSIIPYTPLLERIRKLKEY